MYEALCAENKGLVVKMARRYARVCALDRAVSVEDLVQAGFIGLIQAEKGYDPEAGKSWAAWAAWYICREFDRALGLRNGRFTRADTGADTLDRPLREETGDGATGAEALADDSLPEADAALLREELRQAVREAVAQLADEPQRRVVQLCKLEGKTYQEAAGAMGITKNQAHRLYVQASAKLSRNQRLRALAGLDERTRFHAHKGVRAFNRDWTSVTEGAAMWRIGQQARRGM